MNEPASIEQLRAIPLPDVLQRHGLTVRAEGVSVRARSERHNIVATGDLWFDNRAGVGGCGAIDLAVHLSGSNFSTVCQQLGEQFGVGPASNSLGLHPSREGSSVRRERVPFRKLIERYAIRDDANWPTARAYLVETRGIEPTIVDQLHEVGSIYANDHRPQPALVFLHRASCGKVLGASLRDTRPESTFRPCLGDKRNAWFAIGSLDAAETVVAVESPIDALSYVTLKDGRCESLAVVSCAGVSVSEELMWHAYERRQSFVVALDNDAAGERGWTRAWDETADWPGFKISSDCPTRKDWNDDLRVRRLAHEAQQSPRHSIRHV